MDVPAWNTSASSMSSSWSSWIVGSTSFSEFPFGCSVSSTCLITCFLISKSSIDVNVPHILHLKGSSWHSVYLHSFLLHDHSGVLSNLDYSKTFLSHTLHSNLLSFRCTWECFVLVCLLSDIIVSKHALHILHWKNSGNPV